MPKLKNKQQAKSAIEKNIKMLKELLPSASSVRENVEAQEHINHLVIQSRTLEGIRESDPNMERILTDIDNEIEQIEKSPLVKNAALNARAEAAPKQPIRAKAEPVKPIASEGRRKLANAAKDVLESMQEMNRVLGAGIPAQQGTLVKPAAPPAEASEARQGLEDAVKRVKKATSDLKFAVNKKIATESILPHVAGQYIPLQPQKAVKGQIQPPETLVPQRQKATIIPSPAIKIPDPQPTQFRPARAKAKPEPVLKPAPAAKPAAAPSEDAFTELRRELNKSEPNPVTIKNILNRFGDLDNRNIELVERDPNLVMSLAALKNAITIEADNRVTVDEKFKANVNDTRIHLEQDLMQPIRDTVAALQDNSAPRDLQAQINRALDYSTGLPLYSDLRRPLEELRNQIENSDTIHADIIKNDFDKTVTKHMVGRLRNLLARSQTPDTTELEHVIKQLSAPKTGLPKTHPLLHETALPGVLHQLNRIQDATDDTERHAAQAGLTLAIKNLRYAVTQPERINRNAALEKQIREMNPNDKALIIAKVGDNLDYYTNTDLHSNRAQISRRAKARDESLPVMEQKLEDMKLHLEVYRQHIQTNIDKAKETRPLTDNIRTQLEDLSKAAKDKMSYEVFPILIGRILEKIIDKEHPVYKKLTDAKEKLYAIYNDDALKSDGRLSNAALSEFRDELNRILSETKTLLANDDNWLSKDRAMRERHNKVNASIESLDKILEQGDRSYVKPLKIKILSDHCEVVSKEALQAKLDQFADASTAMIVQGNGNNKSRAFANDEALVTTSMMTTGFGPTKKTSKLRAVISNENGVHTSKLYFHQNELKSSLFGGKDGYTTAAVKTIMDFLETSPTPYKPFVLSGDMPKEFVKEILTFCKLKGMENRVTNDTPHKSIKVSSSDVKSMEERLSTLFSKNPEIAVSAKKQEAEQQKMFTGISAKKS